MSDLATTPDHPAKFSRPILDEIRRLLRSEALRLAELEKVERRRLQVIDPFAGVGRIHELLDEHDTTGIELEPEWAAVHERTLRGDATKLPQKWSGLFDAVATSPCLEQSHRVLTDDLRWVAVGDLQPGAALLAFDEHGPGRTHGGNGARRRWRRTEVVRSVPRSVECVRVILANGDELMTTPEHPWLAYRYAYAGRAAQWISSSELAGWYVLRQAEPWSERRSFDAGWLSGMFDGEGSLSLGWHGSPKLSLCQVAGPVIDRAERLMAEFGYQPNLLWRQVEGRQKIGELYVTDGFPGLLRALGELRPTRLLAKWETLDIATRTIQADRVAVLGVEPAGRRDIQEIETSHGTYFGEGYLMHNCYGNRMADAYDGRDGSKRYTYRISLGRPVSDGSAASMHWGKEYRDLHGDALGEMVRVVSEDRLVIINMSNHFKTIGPKANRKQIEVEVVEWWLGKGLELGCRVEAVLPIETQRMGNGANRDDRADNEKIIVLRTPAERRLL